MAEKKPEKKGQDTTVNVKDILSKESKEAKSGKTKISKPKAGTTEKKPHKHGFKSTHIDWHHDGSATVHHQHEEPSKDVKHAVTDMDDVHDSLEQNIGAPNGDEETEAPEAVPSPAPGPMGLTAS